MRVVALLLLALTLGCAGRGVQLDELPDEPILLVYRTRDESEQRAELIAKAREGAAKRRPGEAMLDLDDAVVAFGLGRSVRERQKEMLGRMAILHPCCQEIEDLPFTLRGARPYDRRGNEQLMFMSARSGVPQLYEWNADTGRIHALTSGSVGHPTGCYGPNGRIAYSEVTGVGVDPVSRIFVTEPGGGSPRPISPGPKDAKPVWSPDGRTLIYESVAKKGRGVDLWALDPDSDEPAIRIARGRDPAFTPDGAWVVYSANTRVGWRLYRMLPNGTGKRAIGERSRDEWDPTVSPDGRYIVYVSNNQDREQLRIRPMDGSADRPLLLDGDGAYPIWGSPSNHQP